MVLNGFKLELKESFGSLDNALLKNRRAARRISCRELSTRGGWSENYVGTSERNNRFDHYGLTVLKFLRRLGAKVNVWVIPDGLLEHSGPAMKWECGWLTGVAIKAMVKKKGIVIRDASVFGCTEKFLKHLTGKGPTDVFFNMMQYALLCGYYIEIIAPDDLVLGRDELSCCINAHMQRNELTSEDLAFKSDLTPQAVTSLATGGKGTFNDMLALLDSLGYRLTIEDK